MTAPAAPDPWVAGRRPNPQARLRLFCFPYAGGSAALFRAGPAALPGTVEVCPMQPPGRGARLIEPPFPRLSPLVRTLAQALVPYFDKPFAFCGHSMGVLVGFELPRQLRRQHG